MEKSQKQPRRKKNRRQAAQQRRTHNVLLAGAFLVVVLLFFLINLVTKDREFSETENRNLSQKPSFSLSALVDGSYFSGLTDWYNDQFFARDGWISLKLWEDSRLGRKESGGVYLCENGYLIANPETPNQEVVAKTVDAVNQFAAEHTDISMRMMLVPGASAILSEYLPKNAPVRDQLQDIADVQKQLDGKIQFLDAASPLSAHASEYIYYQTDHHWTSLGAYYAFTANTGTMGIGSPVKDYDIYTVATDFEGTLASKSGSHAVTDDVQIYVPKDTGISYYVTYSDSQERICSIYNSSALETKDKYTVFFGGNYPTVEIQTTANNGRSLLLFKDSYANSFVQFLVPYYEKIIMVDPRYYYDSLDAILNSYGITDVLFLYSADTFLTDGSLADVLTAEAATGSVSDSMEEFPVQQEPTQESDASGQESDSSTQEETSAESASPESSAIDTSSEES